MLNLPREEKDIAEMGPHSELDLYTQPIIQPLPGSEHFNKTAKQLYTPIMMEEIYEESQESDQTGGAYGNLSSASLLKKIHTGGTGTRR